MLFNLTSKNQRHSRESRNPFDSGTVFFRFSVHLGITLFFLILFTIPTFAQPDITQAEYFFDNDPGVGSANPLSFTQGTSFDISPSLIQSLASGMHTLSVRAKDATGTWGFAERRQFYIPTGTAADPPPADITAMEYYIDNDPGHGIATTIVITTSGLVDLPNEIIAASALPQGFHTLGIRCINTNGVWSITEKRTFYVAPSSIIPPPPGDIVELEYFFDNDPGFGNATSLTITPNQVIDINPLIPESLSAGHHTLSVRAKNADGGWGIAEKRTIYINPTIASPTTPDITKIEYYFDGVDPGVGNGISLPITPGPLVDLNTIDVATSPALIDGQHTITFRGQNTEGVWGMAETSTFDVLDDCTQPVVGFTPQLACAGQSVTFADASTSIQGDAQYRWYLNGDNIIDDTTVGDAIFTYSVPGVYVVALAIRQGTICLDSVSTTITIQPEPVAVFSTEGTTVNQPTNFTASANSLPTGAIWEWDFDGDLIVDDNTVGATSFTYTTEATYNPALTITDGLGCQITVTNPIIITATGGGGTSPPSANFLAENGCVGAAINFIDLSQNIPGGSTYSWDFDGDGLEDIATVGSTTYTYSTGGTFSAKLTINTGSVVVESIQAIEVVGIPISDFSSVEVCEGGVMNFTDQSTNINPAAIYMWDFNNDGIIDSNAKTGVTYTYNVQGSHIVSLSISNGYGCLQETVKQVSVVGLPTPNFSWDIICTGEVISFNNLSTDVAPNATYSWDLDGDGTEDLTTNGDVQFTYPSMGTYNARLTITNAVGCSTTVTKPIEIVDRPIASLTVNAMCYGQPSQMVDMSQNVSPTASYAWDFDNDAIIDDNTVGSTYYTYPSFNTYVVTLTISNGGGCSSSAEEIVVFSDAALPDFSVNKTCEGEEVVFTDLSSGLEVGALYSWDFDGDGLEDAATPGSTFNTFAEAGSYDAKLTIDNGGQCLAYKTITLDVTAPPAVDLGADLNLCTAGDVTFDAGIGYSAYLWPDGSTNQTFTVSTVGDFMVRVQDAKGCFNTDTVSVMLLGPPNPSFEHFIEFTLEGINVHFNNTTTNGDSYIWNFGDGTTSEEVSPVHTYSDFSFFETSVFEVCITSTNACEEAQSCENIIISPTGYLKEIEAEISVYPNPVSEYLNLVIDQEIIDSQGLGIINSQGQIVWSSAQQKPAYQINMSRFAEGSYFLMIVQQQVVLYKRIIKQ